MNDILSLSKARKKKTRAEKEKSAEQNRVKFGRTKAEKKLASAKRKKTSDNLSAHKRDN
ncbi:MAG: DUF4169 family protein [Emcibacteraceae bacterium]|nr:DUF4169 family protein [Emcibacteraceae bacterium]